MRPNPHARPDAGLLSAQSEALSPLRNKLLRAAQVATRRTIVDLGAGAGAVTGELVRRGGGAVIAIDDQPDFVSLPGEPFAGAERVRASSESLPLADSSVDLVFCQLGLLWMPLTGTLDEIRRVLRPGGALVAIEPDLGGMIEWPERGVRASWMDALTAAGADPLVGRKLPGLLEQRGFAVRVQVLPELSPGGSLEMLRGLPLSEAQAQALAAMESSGSWADLAWAPMFGISAIRG